MGKEAQKVISPKTFTTLRLDLTEAETGRRFPIEGTYFYVFRSSHPDVLISVGTTVFEHDRIPLSVNQGFTAFFQTLYISWAAQASKWVDVLIAEAPDFAFITQHGVIQGSGLQVINRKDNYIAATTVAITAGNTVLILPANSQTGGVILRNEGSNTCYLDGVTPVVATDFPLKESESIALDAFSGAIYGYCGAAVATTIDVLRKYYA